MINWFKRQPQQQKQHAAVGTLIDYAYSLVQNASTMTWQSLIGIVNHETQYVDRSKAALKLTAVKCALETYSGLLMGLPRRMYGVDADTDTPTRIISTTSHPASRLFSHYFNPELDSDRAFSMIVYDVLMDGNCYFLREFDLQGRTSRLNYIHPSRIPTTNIRRAGGSEKLFNGRTAVAGEIIYIINTGESSRDTNTQAIIVPKEYICHFSNKLYDAEHFRGQGFVSNSDRSVQLYEASEEFGRTFYTKGIATQMFLTTDNRLDAQVLKRIESNFSEDPNAPLESIFKTRVLEQGLKPVHMGIPFQHLQFIETRAFSVEDVARGFNIPPALLHSYMGTKAGDVDLAQAMSLFVQTGIGPFLDHLCIQFRNELLPLTSRRLFRFDFERIYLYRNVIDKFTISLRNLMEIGVLNRAETRQLLGFFIDPRDAAADPRYVPVNLMTVEHSLLLQEQAGLSNETARSNIEMLELQKEQQRKTNDGMVEPVKTPDAPGATTQKDLNNAPSQDNIDKRLRKANNQIQTAYQNVINGLKQYETRVLDQKKQTRKDDYDAAVAEFYAADGKFANMLREQLLPWQEVVETLNVQSVIDGWLSDRKYTENSDATGSES